MDLLGFIVIPLGYKGAYTDASNSPKAYYYLVAS